MKAYLLVIPLLFLSLFQSFAQNPNTAFKVSKEYDEEGNLIRYDSLRVEKKQWISSNYNFNFEHENLDSLLMGLDHIGSKMGVFITDSIFQKIDQVFKDKNFHIWMDDFDHNDFHLKTHDIDSLIKHSSIISHYFEEKNDSIIAQHLEKELKRIQQKIRAIKAKKEIQ